MTHQKDELGTLDDVEDHELYKWLRTAEQEGDELRVMAIQQEFRRRRNEEELVRAGAREKCAGRVARRAARLIKKYKRTVRTWQCGERVTNELVKLNAAIIAHRHGDGNLADMIGPLHHIQGIIRGMGTSPHRRGLDDAIDRIINCLGVDELQFVGLLREGDVVMTNEGGPAHILDVVKPVNGPPRYTVHMPHAYPVARISENMRLPLTVTLIHRPTS